MENRTESGDQFTSRPAGGTELSWCRAVPGGTGITVLAVHLSRRIPLPLLRSFLRRLQLSGPLLRALLPSSTCAAANPREPILISHAVSEEIEVIPSELLPQPSVSDDSHPISLFQTIVEHELNRNCWAEPTEGEPVGSFFATVYELPPPDGSLLALRIHTGVCDRTSGVAIVKEIIDNVFAEGDRGAREGSEQEQGEVLLAIEDLIRKEDAWKPFWARGKDLLGYSLNGMRSSCLPFYDTVSNRKSEIIRIVIEVDATQKLLAACDAKGVKLCSAITAAAILATHASKNPQINQSETYSVVTLIDCRKYLNPPLDDKHIGFFHSAILNTHTVAGGEELWGVTKRCHDAFSSAKSGKKHLADIGELNFLMCKAMESPQLTPASSLRTALISVFEEAVDCDAVFGELRGIGVEDYVGCASVHGIGASIAAFETIRDRQLECAFVYPSPLHSRGQMLDLMDSMKRILVEGSSTAGDDANYG